MQRGEQIDIFLGQLTEIRDQLTCIGATPDEEMLERTALNVVLEDWQIFVQSFLARLKLLDWEELWAALRQEEIKQLTKAGSSGKGVRIKERGRRGCCSSICGKAGETEEGGETEEEGPLQSQVLPLWGNGSLCEPVSKEKEQGRGF